MAAPSSAGEARAALAQHLEDLGGRADDGFGRVGAGARAPRAATAGRRGARPRSGVAFDGATDGRVGVVARGGVSRSQATSPSWHSRSSHAGS